MNYMSAREVADKWGISQRRVAVLCSENRIKDACMVGNMWLIPSNADKPADARSVHYVKDDGKKVKPFLKWAGGKSQLISEIEKYYPFEDSNITKYAEPFVGGGAILFDILSKYELKEVYISDINAELINTYIMIRDEPNELISILMSLQNEFLSMDLEYRKKYYLEKRERFNILKIDGDKHFGVERAALMIYLNKTCFNGLFRVNKKGLFNVPMGAYKNPLICDENNIKEVSGSLQKVKIVYGDYRMSSKFIDKNTFVYFDPPYRPLSSTSSFTAYTEDIFDDKAQIELANYVKTLNDKGAKFIVSNSDPKNIDEKDEFFDKVYADYCIRRVEATRMINSNSNKRGKIKELVISNF